LGGQIYRGTGGGGIAPKRKSEMVHLTVDDVEKTEGIRQEIRVTREGTGPEAKGEKKDRGQTSNQSEGRTTGVRGIKRLGGEGTDTACPKKKAGGRGTAAAMHNPEKREKSQKEKRGRQSHERRKETIF